MSEIRLHLADDDAPHDVETREARHELLASFLAAYADGELPAETNSQIDVHLAGCARCRRELTVHRTLRDRLSREPVPAATAALRDRIATGIRNAPPPVERAPIAMDKQISRARTRRFPLFTAGVVSFALMTFAIASLRTNNRASNTSVTITSAQSVPVMAAVLADYRRVAAGDLPGRARDLDAVRAAVPFAIAPLSNPNLRLLGAWTTTLAGEPAAVFAYRWNERVVFQYLIPEDLMFQSSNVRTLLARTHSVAAHDGVENLLLWARPESGAVLVGEFSTEEFTAMRAADSGN